jgi:opacity protein-like surface antigen
MRMLASAAAIAAATALATPAAAVTLIVDPITATWSNVLGGANLENINPGTADTTIRWGGNVPTNQKSGYNYTAAAVPINVAVVVNGSSAGFNLGTFTHFNNPIPSGTSITGATLTVTYGLAIDDGVNPIVNLGLKNSVFLFDHWETPNADNPCADGGANGVGVNSNGCADRVRVSLDAGASDFFTINDVDYFLTIAGFTVDGIGKTVFWTREQAENPAQLLGSVTARGVTPTIPEPATWAMLIAGFGMVGLGMRRRTGIARVGA